MMRKRGQEQELTKYGHERRGNTRHRETQSDITPPSRTVRPAPYTIQRGGGVGALEASRDTETGQEASRAAPVPEPMAEWGAWAAMVGQGAWDAMAVQSAWAAMADPASREAMADQGIRDAMAVQSAWAAMADPGRREAMADQGILWPWPLAWPQRPWLYGPPKKNYWGSSPLGADQEERDLWGALGRSGSADTWGRSGSADTCGHLGALWKRGHLGALGRCGHLRALGRRGLSWALWWRKLSGALWQHELLGAL